MTSENTLESPHRAASPWSWLLAILAWGVGAACVAYTTCYAYHLGI